ncbi:hypothetical protein VNO78_19503 [Psophocarpus tetragonolobus]|uniref:Uncharacterized protein n=1 Tax=Psophocarpus tetragonolobus TaxID=3891 RepID=A0AAN9SC13_PSOTE
MLAGLRKCLCDSNIVFLHFSVPPFQWSYSSEFTTLHTKFTMDSAQNFYSDRENSKTRSTAKIGPTRGVGLTSIAKIPGRYSIQKTRPKTPDPVLHSEEAFPAKSCRPKLNCP